MQGTVATAAREKSVPLVLDADALWLIQNVCSLPMWLNLGG